MNVPSTVATAVFFATACCAGGSADTGAPSASFATTLLPAVTTIHIKDFHYRPVALRVHVGDRVTFVNDDDEAHTVTASDASFDSAGMDGRQTWQHVFAKVGTFAYFCQLHPYMKATIVVSAAGGAK